MHTSASSTLNGLRGRQLVILGVLDGDTIISTRKGTGVGGLILVFVGGLGPARRGVDGSDAKVGDILLVVVEGGATGTASDNATAATGGANGSKRRTGERHLRRCEMKKLLAKNVFRRWWWYWCEGGGKVNEKVNENEREVRKQYQVMRSSFTMKRWFGERESKQCKGRRCLLGRKKED